jgi:hypothetical protein
VAQLDARDVRVIALRCALLAVVGPLVVVAYAGLREPLGRALKLPLGAVGADFAVWAAFAAVVIVGPMSLVERMTARGGGRGRPPGLRRRDRGA